MRELTFVFIQKNKAVAERCTRYKKYNRDEFTERVLKFNGGIKGVVKREKNNGEMIPISHFEFFDGVYSHLYLRDKEGFECSKGDFS